MMKSNLVHGENEDVHHRHHLQTNFTLILFVIVVANDLDERFFPPVWFYELKLIENHLNRFDAVHRSINRSKNEEKNKKRKNRCEIKNERSTSLFVISIDRRCAWQWWCDRRCTERMKRRRGNSIRRQNYSSFGNVSIGDHFSIRTIRFQCSGPLDFLDARVERWRRKNTFTLVKIWICPKFGLTTGSSFRSAYSICQSTS